VASPRLRSLIARLEEALLSLSGQEDLELALAQAETAYEELLRRLGEEQEKPSAVLPPEEPSTLTA
jgi:hypothetical protein